jgi:hypothetical protein
MRSPAAGKSDEKSSVCHKARRNKTPPLVRCQAVKAPENTGDALYGIIIFSIKTIA